MLTWQESLTEDPQGRELTFVRESNTQSEDLLSRKLTLNSTQPIEVGWVENPESLLIENVTKLLRPNGTNPNPEELEVLKAQIAVVSFVATPSSPGFQIHPGEYQLLRPTTFEDLHISGPDGTKIQLTIYPK